MAVLSELSAPVESNDRAVSLNTGIEGVFRSAGFCGQH